MSKNNPILNLKIRELSATDFDDMMEVWTKAELNHTPAPEDYKCRFENELQNPNIHYIGAELDGRIVGVMITTSDGRKGWLNRLAVLPEYQRKGIAEKMMFESERILKEKGINVFACLIYADNDMSIPLVNKLGYKAHENVVYFSKRLNKNKKSDVTDDCNSEQN